MGVLPVDLMGIIEVFAPLFTKRVWRHVLVLLGGAILAPGKRTVTAVLRVMGLGRERCFHKHYHLRVDYVTIFSKYHLGDPVMSRLLHIEIQESAEELKRIMNEQIRAKFRERIQILYWIKTELFNSLQELADHLGRSKSVIFKWLKEYRTHGLTGLLQWNYYGGRRSKISEAMVAALQIRLNDSTQGFHRYGEIQQWLLQEYEVDIPDATVHQVVHYRLKAKLRVARPTSIHRDEEAVVSFKKLSRQVELIDVLQQAEKNTARPLRYWSQDESRFGLKTITRRILTGFGIKPVGSVQWNFQSFYLYGAVEPLSGENFFLEFSHLNADCFQLFLDEFSRAYPHSLNVIQLDNGRFHSAKNLAIPDNIVLLFQPP
ncbi:MAG: IS630 family transposase [Candidatus Contendobacter sp.]|nr:IS630 family transposase [Candidatus Contendobacter sp.]